MEKLKLKKHGSFSIREGWFQKAINAIEEFGYKDTFGKKTGVSTLGVGANMVTSIKYWMNASNLIDQYGFTSFGELIKKYDRYLEDDFSWWLIHLFLVINKNGNSPIFNIIFNNFKIKNFNKDLVLDYIKEYMIEREIDMSNFNEIDSDVSVLLRSYLNEKVSSPEDNLNSPLGRLKLLKRNYDGLYSFQTPAVEKLDYRIVYYSLLCCLDNENNVNIDDIQNYENSPVKVFNLDRNSLHNYLNDMQRNGLITVNRTAGLNQVYINEKKSLSDLFNGYYERN